MNNDQKNDNRELFRFLYASQLMYSIVLVLFLLAIAYLAQQ
jgi:hypothetical protein